MLRRNNCSPRSSSRGPNSQLMFRAATTARWWSSVEVDSIPMRKPLAAFGLVLSMAGFIIFIALGIGAWFAKREADKQLASAVEKAHRAGDVASQVIQLVREVIARAKSSLNSARAETRPSGEPEDP